MDELEYVEKRSGATMAVLRQTYDDFYERSYKFATVLVGGGGALGAYALGKIGVDGVTPVAWAPVAALAMSWFGIAAQLIWSGAISRRLSPGNPAGNIIDYYDDRIAEGHDSNSALAVTRRAELILEHTRAREYATGCVDRAEALDMSYRAATICTPLVPAVVLIFCLAR
ncbi:hypothetical protein QRO08_15950 [Paracidovorax citrulli]|nr:hypothetical protein [Paracidovorax citrulli]ATG94647.1 hypothetical protein CQB05_11935 [Paracidovorax citrulli]MVT28530.1 hypothetical protein [Paracidovorax citrulli]PVY66545.1 hypothetical protein C8E08_3954 [Paracidovorax citrulli]REG69286.1 hypothetical protein C8E07_2433 [Paracidovorax citrulli]RLJ93841.1 hypothetical protein C8E06_2433 [Paracidovorax citrulli]